MPLIKFLNALNQMPLNTFYSLPIYILILEQQGYWDWSGSY